MIGCPNDDSDEFENTEIYSKADVSKASELQLLNKIYVSNDENKILLNKMKNFQFTNAQLDFDNYKDS